MNNINNLKKPFNLLQLYENQEIIGTAADKEINIVNDYDLQEYINLHGRSNIELYTQIYDQFKEKFIEAKRSKNIFITDFKCGHYKSIPIRWNYENMKDGYKIVEDNKIWFINALQQKSVIKLDLIYYDNKTGRIHEITQNYYLEINNITTYDKIVKKNIKASLLKSFKDYYYTDKNFYKAMKRLYSYYKIFDKNNKKIQLLQNLFNSNLGKQNKIISDLKTLLLLMENVFRPINKRFILNNLLSLDFNIFDEDIKKLYDNIINNYDKLTKKQIIENIDNIINTIYDIVNNETLIYITKNKLLKNIYI